MSKPASEETSIPAKINTAFAYSDREINAVDEARNVRDGFQSFEIKGTRIATDGTEVSYSEPTGILINAENQYVVDDEGNVIVTLPACAVDQGSHIKPRLEEQLKHLAKLEEIFPVKILFPYKLSGFHWNVGEILISKNEESGKEESGKFEISGTAYDSYGSGELSCQLEEEIQHEIRECFLENGYPEADFFLNKKTEGLKAVQTGVACGLYAAIAMHNLKKHAGVEHVWDGIFSTAEATERLSDMELRQLDYLLIQEYNPVSLETFCRPLDEKSFVDPRTLKPEEDRTDEALAAIESWKELAEKTIRPDGKNVEEKGLTEVTAMLTFIRENWANPLFLTTLELVLFGKEHDEMINAAVDGVLQQALEDKAAQKVTTTDVKRPSMVSRLRSEVAAGAKTQSKE